MLEIILPMVAIIVADFLLYRRRRRIQAGELARQLAEAHHAGRMEALGDIAEACRLLGYRAAITSDELVVFGKSRDRAN